MTTLLSNFVARISEETTRDDGDAQSTRFLIEGSGQDGRPLSAEVSAEEFEGMAWVVAKFGARAIISAGRGMRDNVRAAIQVHFEGRGPPHGLHPHGVAEDRRRVEVPPRRRGDRGRRP